MLLDVTDAVLPQGKYHKGYTTGERKEVHRQRLEDIRHAKLEDRPIIAWDGEGINLSGDGRPQHYVLFGSSVTVDTPLIIKHNRDRLTFEQIAEHMLRVAQHHPDAFHIGYFFKYDQNMILWSLPWAIKQRLYETGTARYRKSRNGRMYQISLVLGKKLRITRINYDDTRVTILIEDIGSFFASTFVAAYESMFKDLHNDPTWQIVVEGKKMRADTTYEDLPAILKYWKVEIIAVARLGEQFKEIMYRAGFMLSSWYGPGALANYIRRANKLVEHEWGGKEENLPELVHMAAKSAFVGGHFEQYKVGRIQGPIYAWDINSAYPFAFTKLPSMAEGGEWVHTGTCDGVDTTNPLSVYHLRYLSRHARRFFVSVPMPLPHRDAKHTISYPPYVEGWYWLPEASLATKWCHPEETEILDSWTWKPGNDAKPWDELLSPMYLKRLALKSTGDPVQMAFKLGPNSLYGKMAQRAGWDKHENKPPGSHTLPIAGWVTSYCRMRVMQLIYSCKPGNIIAVETDGIFTLTSPDEIRSPHLFPIGKGLGEWSVTVYDEIIYIQNGLYMARQGDEWVTLKTRGIDRRTFLDSDGNNSPEVFENYLDQCRPGERWSPVQYPAGKRFLGLGAAIGRATKFVEGRNIGVMPHKADKLHCSWGSEERKIDANGGDKRVHIFDRCHACHDGLSANQGAHDLMIRSRARPDDCVSVPYPLPWERGYEEPEWLIRLNEGNDLMSIDQV